MWYVCVYMHVHICVGKSVGVHLEAQGWQQVSFSIAVHLTCWGRVCSGNSLCVCLCFQGLGLQVTCHAYLAPVGFLGLLTCGPDAYVWCLHGKYFPCWTPPLSHLTSADSYEIYVQQWPWNKQTPPSSAGSPHNQSPHSSCCMSFSPSSWLESTIIRI